MLIIGHRGSRGTQPENSMAGFRDGFDSGAAMLEFDIQLTRDKVPVVIHDPNLLRTHHTNFHISRHTMAELQQLGLRPIVPALEQVLDKYFAKIMLNIEVKARGSAAAVIDLLEKKYVTQSSDWEHIIISSFSKKELIAARKKSSSVRLALLHAFNPFAFLLLHRRIQLTAAGFHRLHINAFALMAARRIGIWTYVYTVNHLETANRLTQKKVDGVVTDFPQKFAKSLR